MVQIKSAKNLLKEFTDQPEFLTFMEYAPEFLLDWLWPELENAPGGPPEFMLD